MKILLAIDDSSFSQAAIQSVLSQIRPKGAEVCVLHVVEPVTVRMSAARVPHFVRHLAEVEKDRRKQATVLVQRAARKLREAGFKASGVVEMGNPKVMIIDHAAEWQADLIVVGSHGWTGLNRFLLGSVSEAVTRHAGCSVQVVRPATPAKPARSKKSKS
jgi:nucleotide-binding universal stress UspA family protein